MRRRDTYYGSHLEDEFAYLSDTRYCLYYDEGMCKRTGCECRVYGFCDNYITKRGKRLEQENAIKEQIRQEFQEMKQKEEKDRIGKIIKFKEKIADWGLKIGSEIKHGKFGIGEVVSINNDSTIDICFYGKSITFQFDENFMDYFERV